MSLRDELELIEHERYKREAQLLSDEEVYQMLVQSMYERSITDYIKRQVSEGKTKIVGEFVFAGGIEINDKVPWDKLSSESTVYKMVPGYECSDSCEFRALYVYKKGFFKKDVYLTPLGERVYKDLQRLAQKDQVILSEPFPVINTGKAYGTGWSTGSMHVKFEYQYR